MAMTAYNFIPTAQNAREMATMEGLANSDTALQLAIANVIRVAIVANTYSTTISILGKAAADIQETVSALLDLGYTWSISGTTLTISW